MRACRSRPNDRSGLSKMLDGPGARPCRVYLCHVLQPHNCGLFTIR